jgi:hypothetical protein
VLLADPSGLVPPTSAAKLRTRGFEVRVVPNTGHSVQRDDFEGIIKAGHLELSEKVSG